jgi:hypothetical protein
MKPGAVALLLAQLLGLAACKAPVVEHRYLLPNAREALAEARKQWQARVPEMAGYELSLEVSCYCTHAGHYRLRVKPGQRNELIPDHPFTLVPEHLLDIVRGYDVDGLFQVVDTGLNEGDARVDVIYDQDYGYPIALQLDGDAKMSDDELQIIARLTTFPREVHR